MKVLIMDLGNRLGVSWLSELEKYRQEDRRCEEPQFLNLSGDDQADWIKNRCIHELEKFLK
ncbi:MAG: hypothetical protein ABFD92_07445 [Planctomycetaceae bacterium]|nr:hypothetical protein [Planctomycetaceae bacterium]